MVELEDIKIDRLKLRAARGSRKMTDVARTIGISKQKLWNYENTDDKIPGETLAKLCILYRTPIEKLTTADEVFLQKVYSAA